MSALPHARLPFPIRKDFFLHGSIKEEERNGERGERLTGGGGERETW
jgi:hypothetical protein